jgi:LysM domain
MFETQRVSGHYAKYSEWHEVTLRRIRTLCNLPGPTEAGQLPDVQKSSRQRFCVSGKTYITREGDTCDSISIAHQVPTVPLYELNKAQIGLCQHVKAGEELCLPVSCEKTYLIEDKDKSCKDIQRKLGLDWDDLTAYNPWLYLDCSNLGNIARNVGRVMCASPQGNKINATWSTGDKMPTGGRGNGHVQLPDHPVAPPAVPATGTTPWCGHWEIAGSHETCEAVLRKWALDLDALKRLNPSLARQNCQLEQGKAYCVLPVKERHNSVFIDRDSISEMRDGASQRHGGKSTSISQYTTEKTTTQSLSKPASPSISNGAVTPKPTQAGTFSESPLLIPSDNFIQE